MKTIKIFMILALMMLIISERSSAQCNLSVSFTNTINTYTADITPLVSGGSGINTIIWYTDVHPVIQNFPFVAHNSGIYVFEILDSGCSEFFAVDTISIPGCQLSGGILASAGPVDDTFQALISNGTSPYTYLWDSSNTFTGPVNIVPVSGAILFGLLGSCVLIQDANGCQVYTCDTLLSDTCHLQGSISSYSDGADTILVAHYSGNSTPIYSLIWSNYYQGDSITASHAGIYCIEIQENNACTVSICDTVGGILAGISDIANNNTIKVYPNPSSGTFSFSGINNGDAIEVFDMLGQKVYTSTADQDNYTVNLSNKGKGIFIYKINDGGNNTQTGKIIIE